MKMENDIGDNVKYLRPRRYADADFASDLATRKSPSGMCTQRGEVTSDPSVVPTRTFGAVHLYPVQRRLNSATQLQFTMQWHLGREST